MNRRDFIKKLMLLPAIYVAPDVLGRIMPSKISGFKPEHFMTPVDPIDAEPALNAKCQLKLNGGEVIHYNSGSPFSGTTFPVGTASMPVNNLSDAREISDKLNLIAPEDYYVTGYKKKEN